MSAEITKDELLRFARKVRVEILEDLGDHEKLAALKPLDEPAPANRADTDRSAPRAARRVSGVLRRRRGRSA